MAQMEEKSDHKGTERRHSRFGVTSIGTVEQAVSQRCIDNDDANAKTMMKKKIDKRKMAAPPDRRYSTAVPII